MSTEVLGLITFLSMAIIVSLILLFVGIGILILIHICIVGRAFRRGFGLRNIDERGNIVSTSMSNDDLEKLPCFDFKAGECGSSPMDCVVCLESFEMGDKCRLLPLCKHSFHAQCVDSWLLKTAICPICRSSAYSLKGSILSGEESSRSTDIGLEMRDTQSVEVGTQLSSSPHLHLPGSDSPV